MTNREFPGVEAAVVLISDKEQQKFLWTWNRLWRAFSLPVSKLRFRNGIRDAQPLSAAQEAAERAAAEAIGVPVVVHHDRQLTAIIERSGRDARLKSYSYQVFRAVPHERFTRVVSTKAAHVWLSGYDVLSGEFRPLATSSVKVMENLIEIWGGSGLGELAADSFAPRH